MDPKSNHHVLCLSRENVSSALIAHNEGDLISLTHTVVGLDSSVIMPGGNSYRLFGQVVRQRN